MFTTPEKQEEATVPMIVLVGGRAASGKTFFCDTLARHMWRNTKAKTVGVGEKMDVWHRWSEKGLCATKFDAPRVHTDPDLVKAIFDAGQGDTLGGQLLLHIQEDALSNTSDPTSTFFINCQTAEHARAIYTTMRPFVPMDSATAFATLHLVCCENPKA